MSIEVENANWVGTDNRPSRNGVIVVFYDKEVQDMKRTMEEGRACFNLKTYIRKEVPGDNLVAIDRPVRDSDKYEFATEWQRYQSKQTDVIDGTPIDQWPILNRAQVAEFKALHIHSVEQFLAMPMGHGAKIMGFNQLRDKAQQFLNWQKEASKVDEIKAKDAEKDAIIQQLQDRLAALEAAPRRGRPRKVVENVANAA
jgi:hypothetical protein